MKMNESVRPEGVSATPAGSGEWKPQIPPERCPRNGNGDKYGTQAHVPAGRIQASPLPKRSDRLVRVIPSTQTRCSKCQDTRGCAKSIPLPSMQNEESHRT